MGGIGYSIDIEKPSGELGGELTLNQFHYSVWERLSGQLGYLKKVGNRITTTDYIWSSAYDGLREGEGGEWSASDTELSFSFRDMAGCCNLSCEASLHWVWMAFARLRDRLDRGGWRVVGPNIELGNLLVRGPSYPLVYVRKGMFAAVRRKAGQPLVVEDTEAGFGDSARVEWSELAGKDRDTVEWSALTGLCQCDLCAKYRTFWQPVKERYKPLDHLAAARAAWDLLDTGAQAALEQEACGATAAWTWSDRKGPPALGVLADWLGERGAQLPMDALAGMVMSRGRR